jgi:hypothetical protein
MPRKLKPYKVDDVHHRLAKVDIMFDREDKVFFAQLGIERVEAPDVETCKKLTVEMIPRAVQLEWKPMIEVEGGIDEVQKHHCEHVRLVLSYVRFEFAERLDGGQLQRAHSEDSDDPTRRSERYVEYPEMRTLLPYTEETWAALGRLRETIEAAGNRLEAIRKKPEALLAMLAGKTSFLALPEAAPKKGRNKK